MPIRYIRGGRRLSQNRRTVTGLTESVDGQCVVQY